MDVRVRDRTPEEVDRLNHIGEYAAYTQKFTNSEIEKVVIETDTLEDVINIVSLAGTRKGSELKIKPGIGRLPETVLRAAAADLESEVPFIERAVGVPWKHPNRATPAQLLLSIAHRARAEMWNVASSRAFYDAMDEVLARRLDKKSDGTVLNMNERATFMSLYPNVTHVDRRTIIHDDLPIATADGGIEVDDSEPVKPVWTDV